MRQHTILPTHANLRFHRRWIAIGVIVALLALSVGLIVIASGKASSRGRSPLGLIVGIVLVYVPALVAQRSLVARLDGQARQLASYGRHFAPRQVRTEMQQHSKVTHRHVVVAQWQDAQGEKHEAISDPFDYDPYPLLDRTRIEVLADPFDPKLCLVLQDGLPPRNWRRLDAAQRERALAQGPISPGLLWFARQLLIWLSVGTLAWLVFRLVNIRFGLVDWI